MNTSLKSVDGGMEIIYSEDVERRADVTLVVLRWIVVSVARRILASARVACSGHALRGRGLARVVVALQYSRVTTPDRS